MTDHVWAGVLLVALSLSSSLQTSRSLNKKGTLEKLQTQYIAVNTKIQMANYRLLLPTEGARLLGCILHSLSCKKHVYKKHESEIWPKVRNS